MDSAKMNRIILEMRYLLRLEDWRISTVNDDRLADTNAFVSFEREEKRATIHFTEDVTERDIRHEMCHVLLHDMAYVASEGSTVDRMTFYNMLEERVCNVLADALDIEG